MKRLKYWLLENPKILSYTINIILILILARIVFIDSEYRKAKDFYSPIIYILLIIWIYYSIFCSVIKDDRLKAKIVLNRRFYDTSGLVNKMIKLTFLILLGHRTLLIFGKTGVLISLFITTITGFLSVFMIVMNSWEEIPTAKSFKGKFIYIILSVGIVGYIYLQPWRNAICSEYGVEEIGNYFEKDTYEAKYYVNIRRVSKEYKIPADIVVSNGFSTFKTNDRNSDIGLPSFEITETRYAKINKVYFENGGYLFFKNCLVDIEDSYGCECVDQQGED